MLLNAEQPGWLAEVKAGATTIWENWEGDLSQNHYSPGAVCQWLFETVGGIRPDGENHFIISPRPGGNLTYADTEYQSLYGRVKTRWEIKNSETSLHVEIPANTTAEFILPNGETQMLTAGTFELRI